MTAASSASRSRRASSPWPARRTRNSAARIASSASRTRGSSSTTRTVVCSTNAPRWDGSDRVEGRGDGLPVAEDLVQRLAVFDAPEPRRPQLSVPDETVDLPEGLLARDDMRVEEPCHPLDAGRRDHGAADDDQLAAPVGADRARHDLARADPDADVEGRQGRLPPPRPALPPRPPPV